MLVWQTQMIAITHIKAQLSRTFRKTRERAVRGDPKGEFSSKPTS